MHFLHIYTLGDVPLLTKLCNQTSNTAAATLAIELQKPFSNAFVKNRYIYRTFIVRFCPTHQLWIMLILCFCAASRPEGTTKERSSETLAHYIRIQRQGRLPCGRQYCTRDDFARDRM